MRGEASSDFNTLFDTFYVRLARLLYRITGDFGRAEEMASEAFWRLHRKPPAVTTNIEGWLYRTGLRLALDQIKKDRRRARYEGLGAVFGLAAGPEQELERIEERTRLRRALGALKADQVATNWFGYSGGPSVERITLLWSVPGRAYVLRGVMSVPSEMTSLDLAGAVTNAIDLANTIE